MEDASPMIIHVRPFCPNMLSGSEIENTDLRVVVVLVMSHHPVHINERLTQITVGRAPLLSLQPSVQYYLPDRETSVSALTL